MYGHKMSLFKKRFFVKNSLVYILTASLCRIDLSKEKSGKKPFRIIM